MPCGWSGFTPKATPQKLTYVPVAAMGRPLPQARSSQPVPSLPQGRVGSALKPEEPPQIPSGTAPTGPLVGTLSPQHPLWWFSPTEPWDVLSGGSTETLENIQGCLGPIPFGHSRLVGGGVQCRHKGFCGDSVTTQGGVCGGRAPTRDLLELSPHRRICVD